MHWWPQQGLPYTLDCPLARVAAARHALRLGLGPGPQPLSLFLDGPLLPCRLSSIYVLPVWLSSLIH